MTPKKTKRAVHIMPSDIMTDIGLLREALAAKRDVDDLQAKVKELTHTLSDLAADLADLETKHNATLTRLEETLTYSGVEKEVLSSLKREKALLTSNLEQTKAVVSSLKAQRGYWMRKARSGMSSLFFLNTLYDWC